MAEASLSPPSNLDTMRNSKRRWRQKIANKSKSLESDRLDFLPWNQAVTGGDPFTLLSGGVEGGFLSLDEIDESEYCLLGERPDMGSEKKKENSNSFLKSKKRKRGNGDAESEGDGSCVFNEGNEEEKKGGKKKKKWKKRRNKDHNTKELISDGELEHECDPTEGNVNNTNAESATNEEPLGDDEIYAWNELRLHPLLIKSIRRLGFIKPTPIQKACIPVAAHHGKDVIGAAQTGSGKTLAFGLPILQRLLEEREKARRFHQNETEVTGGSEESHHTPC